MADYHPLIARAVAGLEKNTGEARRALYERARTALVAQLRGVVPPLDESEITRERLALEEAIRKVEAESARHAREVARPAFIKRAEIPRREETPRAAPAAPREKEAGAPAAQPVSPPPKTPAPARKPVEPGPSRPPAAAQTAPAAASAPPAEAAKEPAAKRPASGPRRSLSDEALKGFRDVANEPPPKVEPRRQEQYTYAASSDASLPPAPSIPPPPAHPLEEYGQLEPQVAPENLWALPLDGAQPEAPHDYAPSRADAAYPPATPEGEFAEPAPGPARRPRSYSGLIRVALVAILIAAVGGLAYWQRAALGDLAGGIMALVGPSAPPPREAAAPTQRKITDRIGQPETAPQAGPPVAQRVVLYEEDPSDAQGRRFVGTVLWRTEMKPPAPGRAPELAVRADIEVPERKLTVTWSLRRNADQSLPASHTIEIVFNLPADSDSGGVQNVPGVLMKQAEQTRGVPLAGLAVKVTPGYFLIGLSALETDMQRNVQLLKERPWFDIPIVYNNNRRAILAMEKGTPGEKAFGEAFASWKQ
jgi:hypothetical protein